MRQFSLAALSAALLSVAAPAFAQVNISGYTLPMDLALQAAQTAVKACAAHGYAVSAAVVDTAGLVIVQLRGDHATVHTKDSSFRKAYTVVSMGPIFGFDRTSGFVALIAKAPNGAGPALADLPDILALPGGVGIKHGSEIVAGLGVGGAPGGDRDEVCAADGVAAIADKVK
jgi:uncharacterized protein GlcG (DUF336 family)